MEKKIEKESFSIMLMIKIKELNMKELLKMIFNMVQEKCIINLDILIKEYFNLEKNKNLDYIYVKIKRNSLVFIRKIYNKDSV